MNHIGRNDPCPCGSGKKYKKCCMIKSTVGYGTDEFLKSKIVQDLLEFSKNNYKDAIDEAFEFFWHDFNPFESNDKELVDFCETNFMEWFIYDWEIDEDTGKTIIDIYLKENPRLIQDEITVLKRMRDAYISLYEVQAVFPEQGLLLKDLFSNEEFMVKERLATRSVRKWDIFATRLIYIDEKYIISGCVYPYPLNNKENIINHINKCYQDYKKESPSATFKQFLKKCSFIFNDIWCIHLKNPPQPILVTTDKELLVFSKATYHFVNKNAIINELSKAKELKKIKENEFLWLNEKDTILARIEVKDQILNLECFSKERLERSKKLIDKYLKNIITHKSDEFYDPKTIQQSIKNLGIEPPYNPLPQELYTTHMREYYEKWLNEKIPALNGKTPIEAVKTKKGKEKVIAVLKLLENTQENNKKEGRPYFDTAWIWERLNISPED